MALPLSLADVASHALGPTVGLAIGLLVGLERERNKGRGPGRASAGVRTFSMLGLAGATAGMIGTAAIYVAGVFLAAAMVVSYLRTLRDDPGLTTELAMLLTFLLGVLALTWPGTAGCLGVVTAILLANKYRLHGIARRWLSEAELHDLLILLTCAFVVLPLLPNAPLDPWGAINPRQLWILVVAIMGISTLGYLALRIIGTRFGLAIAGIAGGFVSSTATVLAMADRAKADRAQTALVASAAIMSHLGTLVQFAVVVSTFYAPLLERIFPALAAAVCATIASALIASWRSFVKPPSDAPFVEKRPFEPASVFKLVALLAAVMLALAIVRKAWGGASLPWMMALSAVADVHAAAAVAAQVAASGQIDMPLAVLCLTIALITNGLWKCAIGLLRGGFGYGLRVTAALMVANATFALTALVHQ